MPKYILGLFLSGDIAHVTCIMKMQKDFNKSNFYFFFAEW